MIRPPAARATALVLVPALLALALPPRARAGTDDAAAIRAARLAQNAAIAAHSMDSAATFWTANVTITAGLGSTLVGRAAYRDAFAHDNGFRYDRQPGPITLSTNWPLAEETGTWAGYPAGSATPVIQGRYSAMWVKEGGRWRIRSELFVALSCASTACRWPVDPMTK
ncbi:MAG TPA: nuclear transport factor 2 family protein [Gemmatimonadales bacterium]|nr:nuclear transport factor 2 family protein [Gemmatimonadales bacterium]